MVNNSYKKGEIENAVKKGNSISHERLLTYKEKIVSPNFWVIAYM